MRNGDWLASLVEEWFHSDLDIDFMLKPKIDEEVIADAIHGEKGRVLYCTLESNAYYVHKPTVRHKGDRRRFIVIEGNDSLFEEVKEFCYTEYDKSETMELIQALDEGFTICPAFWRTNS